MQAPLESHVTLLVVDDDLVAQARMNAYFSKEGYRVLLAGELGWHNLAPRISTICDRNLPPVPSK